MEIETGIRKTLIGWQAWFKIGNQTFHLEDHSEGIKKQDKHTAKWFKNQLEIAFKKLK